MNRQLAAVATCFFLALALVRPALGAAQEFASRRLAPPWTDGGKPLMQVLKERATSRSFSAGPLPEQVLSNLVWAAFGVNRPESGRRTAPSAQNWREIDVYVAMANGTAGFDEGHEAAARAEDHPGAVRGISEEVGKE